MKLEVITAVTYILEVMTPYILV